MLGRNGEQVHGGVLGAGCNKTKATEEGSCMGQEGSDSSCFKKRMTSESFSPPPLQLPSYHAGVRVNDKDKVIGKSSNAPFPSNSSFLVSGSSTSHLTQDTPQHPAKVVSPGVFEPTNHFYERVLEAKIHPSVKEFFKFDREQTIAKYCETHPEADSAVLRQMLAYAPSHFFWSGVDLLAVKKDPAAADGTPEASSEMIILETNSCPSGQKSMPCVQAKKLGWGGGYATLMTRFLELTRDRESQGLLPSGVLAILYDKNLVEVSGYAQQLANVSNEDIFLVELYNDDPSPCARWDDQGILSIRTADGAWQQVRAAFRYVTQQPWTRIPVNSRTFIFNSILSCLAGGRNKLIGHKAYETLNTGDLLNSGVAVRTPKTFCDVLLGDIPALVATMDHRAVIKIPYSNAGQGVFTVHSRAELDDFMVDSTAVKYEKFIVQELIDSVGTVPTGPRQYKFVWDLRIMITATPEGYKPLVLYARKAAAPLISNKDAGKMDEEDEEQIRTDGETDSTSSTCGGADSRSMYLTNLSEKLGENQWTTDTERLVVLDEEDFGCLGLGIDGLVDGYVQAVLATVAIDKMATRLWSTETGCFDKAAFRGLSDDAALLSEIYM